MTETEATALAGVNTVMFDFYGTVVDMQGGLTKAITPFLEGKGYTANAPSRVVTWWRRNHFENSMIDALLHRDHTPYKEIGRQTVHYTFDRAGIVHTDEEVLGLVGAIEQLMPFDDVVDSLTSMKDLGYDLVILSNGDPDMLQRGVEHSGTGHLWTRVISVAEASSFKPHADTYRTAAELMGLSPDQVLFVANHAFDCVGAKAQGMRTAFINRRHRPFGNSKYGPDLDLPTMAAVASVMASRGPVDDLTPR